MVSFLSNFVIFKLLGHADVLTFCIFWFLMCASFVCLVIFIMKMRTYNHKIYEAEAARLKLQSIMTLEELAQLGSHIHGTMAGKLISRTLISLRRLLKTHTAVKSVLLPHEHEHIKGVLHESLQELIAAEELFVPFLKLSAETGPLIGLMGTVWGLINAFSRISDRQTADIPTVAPGIAEALVITLAGLVVAIPALVYYFVTMQKLKRLEHELEVIADRVEWIIESSLRTSTSAGLGTLYEPSLSQKSQ
jgi:biopolymer transport protein TolQ